MKIAYLPTEFYKPPLSEVEKGVEAFKAETKALGAGGLALAAQGLQNIIPDAVEPGLLQKGKEWGLRKSEEIMSAHQADPRMQARIQRVEDIKSATDAKDWALYQGTKGLLNVATMALGGGIGAGLARGAVKEGVKRYAKAEVGKRVGQTLVTKAGQKAAQQQINTAMARGAIAGGAASSFLMEGGESYSSLVNDEGHSSEEAFLPAFTVGVVNAALDVVPGVIAAKYVGKTLKEIKGGLKSQILKDPTLAKKVVHVAKQAAKGAAGGVAMEGVTEGLQELVQIAGERWAAETNIFAELSPEQQSRVLNAAAAGGLTGGLLGGVGGTFRGVGEAAMAEQEVPPSPPPPPASPTVEAPAPQGPPGALPAPVLEGEFIEGEQPPPPPPPQAGRQGQTVDPDFAGLPPPQQQLPPPQGQLPPPPGAPPFELTPPEAPPEGPAPVPPAPAEPNPGQMELDLQVPRAPLFERLVPPETETESDPNYFYHATSIENLQDIITSGQLDIFSPDYGTDQSRWPDDGEEPRSYWRPDAASTASFAPEYGKPVVVRAKKTDAFKREGAGDFYRQDVLPAEELEVLTKDGWEPLASQIQRPVEETPTEQPRPELVLTPPEAPMEETPVQEAPVPQLADPQQLELDPQQLSPVQPLNEKTRPEWETWLRNSKLAGEEVLTNKSLDELSKFPSDVAIRFRELIDTYDSGQISKSEYRTKAAALYKEARGTDTKPENTTPAPTENVSLAETDLSTEERTRLGVLSTLERWGDLTDEQRPVLDDLRRRAGPEETAPEVAPVVTKEYSFQPVTSRERLTEVRTKDYKYFATRGSAKAGVTKFLKDNPWYKPEEVVIEPRDEGFVGVLVKQGERLVPTDREILENPKGAPLQKAENILNKLSAMYKVDEGAARRLALDLTDVVMPAPYGTAKRDAQVKKSEEFYEKLVKEKLEPTERRKFLYELLKVASALPEGQRPVDWQSVFTKDLGEEVSNPAFDPIWDRLYDGKLENLDPSGMELKAGSLAVMAKVSPMDVLRDMQTRVRKLVSGVDWLKFDSLPPAQRERLLPYRSIYQKVDAMGVLASLRQALQEDAATAQPATDILDRAAASTYNPVAAGIAPWVPQATAPAAPLPPVQAPTNKTPLDVLVESYGLNRKVAKELGFTEEELRAKAPAGGTPFKFEGGTVRPEYVLNKLRENGFDVQSPEDIVRLVRGQLGAENIPFESRVWHAGPNQWEPEPGFPRGRPWLDKVGTGEGGQMFGWGWYSAENEEVSGPEGQYARQFSRALQRDNPPMYAGQPIDSYDGPTQLVLEAYRDSGTKNRLKALEVLQVNRDAAEASHYLNDQMGELAPDLSQYDEAIRLFDQIDPAKLELPTAPVYRLDIPDQHISRMLQWEKPLSEQTGEVKEALLPLAEYDSVEEVAFFPAISGNVRAIGRNEYGVGRTQAEAIDSLFGTVRASELYDRLQRTLPQVKGEHPKKKVSEYLRSLGIVGNKYEDQGSRGARDKTYNYVVWDQEVLDEVGRNHFDHQTDERLEARPSATRTVSMDEFVREAAALGRNWLRRAINLGLLKVNETSAPNAPSGIFDPATGVMTINLDKIPVGENALGVLLHEAGAHAGLEAMIGPGFAEMVEQVRGLTNAGNSVARRAMLKALQEVADRFGVSHELRTLEGDALQAEINRVQGLLGENATAVAHLRQEQLAYYTQFAAQSPDGLFRRVVNAVKAWFMGTEFGKALAAAGLTPQLSDGLMVALAVRAAQQQVRLTEETAHLRADGRVTEGARVFQSAVWHAGPMDHATGLVMESRPDYIDEDGVPVSTIQLVDDQLAKELDAGETITLYRAMALIDGKLYPPMSAKITDESGKLALRNPEPIGKWQQAEERPDLVPTDGRYKGQFPLKKPGGGTTWALYAPYFHASPLPLNDQFTAAYKNDGVDRPQIVTVEVEVPASEMTSGYQARGSVKKVGPNSWNSGVVASKLPGGREVFLSRYLKIKRIVPDAEVAQKIAEIVIPNRLQIPENTVTPQLRVELEKQGVRIAPKGTRGDDIRYSERDPLPTTQIKPAVEPNILESRPGSTPDSPIWFSPLGVAVAGLKQNKAPAAQWRQTILQQNKDGRWTPKLPGVRVEEIEDLGLLEWLDAKQGSVTKEEILRFVEQGGPKLEEVVKTDAEEVVGTDAEQRVRYWLEGGAGRRGPFWTVEEAESWRVDGDELVKELGASVPRHARYQTPGGENYRELLLKLPAARSDNYHSSHWSEPNVVVHIRFNERKDAEGRRVLFVEEVQSDWAQEGKKYGYGLSVQEAKELEELLAWHKEHASFEADMERAERLNEMTEEEAEAFVLSAAEQTRENNLDRIAELKQKKQHATPLTPFKSTSSWAMLGMKRAIRWAVDNGFDQVAWTTGETQVQRYPENPPNGPWQKGMEGFYDQILPAEVNKFLRKHRVKVRLGEVQPGQTAWTLDIPPSLREEAQGGMPLYSMWDFVKDPAKAVFGAVGHNVNNLSRYEKFRSYIQDRFFLMKEHQRKEYFAVLNGVKLKALGRGREDALSALNDPANNFPPGAKVEFLPSETPLPESQMVHETFEEAPKRKADRRQQMKERYLDPMLRLAGKYGITLDELDALAYARHAPEANERLRRVTAKSWFNEMLGEMSGAHRAEFLKKKKAMLAATQGDRKARQRGYLELIEGTAAQGYQDGAKYKASSKTLLRWNAFYEKPSGMSEQESQELLQQFDPAHVDEIFTLFDEMNRSVVAQLVAGGVLTQEQAARWTGAYKHYATLHRASYEHEGTSHGGGMSVGKAARVRHGSAEIAVDVFTSTVESMERAMNLIENNRVMNVLKNFLDANPDPTFMDVVRKDQVHYLDKEGSVVVGSAKGRGQHEAVGFKDGKMFIIRAKNNEKARAVIAALNNIDGPRLGPIMSSFMTVTKFMSAMSTSWSPEFFFVNAPRDFLESLYNVQDADGAKVWKEMVSGYAKSARALHRVFRARSNGKPIPQGEWEQWVRAFEQNGGPTGWMDVFESTEKHRNALETRMKELHPKANFHKGLRSVIDWVEDYNAIAENVIRLSLFKALVGDLNNPKIPIRRATSIAKNLTVNFNRRGTAGPALNALYMFANAGIQGSVRIIGALKNSSTVRKMVVATVVMSMIVDQINRAMDDDEEYDKIPAHIKERNLVFMNPFGGHAVLIPAPWGYNVFWRMGQVISEGIEASQGNMRGWTPGGAALDMTSVIFNAFMPIHGPTLAQTLTPSPLRPLTQIVENKDAFGQKLKPEPFPGQVIPETQQYWSNASAASKMLTELLGRGTGGDDVTSGLIDISPAWTDAIAKELTGAVGRQILTLTSLPFKAAAGEAEVRDMPVLRKFVAFPSDAQETAMYHDRVAQVLDAERRLAAYMEGPRRDVERAQELRREAAPLLQMGPQVKDVERQLKSLRTRLKAAEARGDQMQVETIKEKMELVRQRFNQKWEQRVM